MKRALTVLAASCWFAAVVMAVLWIWLPDPWSSDAGASFWILAVLGLVAAWAAE